MRNIAAQFKVSASGIYRHKQNHPLEPSPASAPDYEPFPADPAPVDTPAPHSSAELHPILMVRAAPSQLVKRARESAGPEGGLPTFYQEALTEIEKLDQDAAAIQAKAKDPRTELLALRERGRLLGIRFSHRELLARGSGELVNRAPVQVSIELSFGAPQASSTPALPDADIIDIDPK